jgi:hypothetical protein
MKNKKYHTVGTFPKSRKTKKYHTVGTFPKSRKTKKYHRYFLFFILFFTNKTDHHDITEILLNVALILS